MSSSGDERLSVAALQPGRLAWLLARFRGEVIERWKQRVLEDPEVPNANRLSTPALEDHVPKLIQRLTQRLTRHAEEGWGERVGREIGTKDVGPEHAQQRFAVHYTQAEALRELSHFRATMIDLCAEHQVVPNQEESLLLHATIDEMMAQSATELERFSLARYEQAMAVVAHELRTPLNAISMAAQRMELAADPASTKVGEFLSRSARTMSRLVEDLLLYSKLEADRFSIHAVTVDVREVVREACEVLQALARRRGVDIAASIPDTAVSCVCDHDRILQALGNLVSNAIRFTPKGGLVRVELEPQAERCVFRVADTGPGISADHIEHIFRPFWQAPGATQGAGLGLAIARGIVEAHGGEIAAEHSARPGAVFTFWLPNEGSPKASASLPAAAPP